MSQKIFLLPDQLANQIAAGEVAQRPSSVLKELLENAVDAKSTSIKALIKDGGSTLIQVIDNGQGMNEIDARMSFERHATSKIKSSTDLSNIQTLGFRGEALASIAAVSKISLITRAPDQELGTHLTLSSSNVQQQVPTTSEIGTSISVKNLFFNVPARRKFLKSTNVENSHLIEEFQRIALANPQIAFKLYQNKNLLYQLPSQKLAQRITHLFGKNHEKKLLPCQASTELIKIYGYISPPKDAKKTRGEQFFFVNNRYIKNTYLSHAVKKAFEGLIAPNTFPSYMLYINLPPAQIDINVHPTKTEIKFQEESLIYGIINTAIKKALANYHIIPSLDFEQIENYTSLVSSKPPNIPPSTTISQQEKDYSLFRNLPQPTPKEQPAQLAQKTSEELLKKDNDLANKLLVHKQYIIAQVKSGALLIDLIGAYERIIYERILHQNKASATTKQKLLISTQITLQPADLSLIQHYQKETQALGFDFKIQTPNTVIISAAPPEIKHQCLQELFEELIEQYKLAKQNTSLPTNKNWIKAIAKKVYFNENLILSNVVIESMIAQLFSCQNPNYTPEGKTIWKILTKEKLNSLMAEDT
ncbi:MAG: DNA mismatch repair endonuclease MutL [Bacteroidota bacterium]